MRVLLINDHGRAYGGAEIQTLAIRDALTQRGHEVRFFATDAEMLPGFDQQADVTCHGRSDRTQVALQSFNPFAPKTLRRELRNHPPDVVCVRSFLWQLSPSILPALRQVPVLHMAPTHKEICPNGLKLLPDQTICSHSQGPICHRSDCISGRTYVAARLQAALLARWRDALDLTVVLSRQAARMFRQNGWPDVEVLGNPVDESPAPTAPGDVPTVVYAGRLAREKGVEVLIDAFRQAQARVPGAKLIIAGIGPLSAQLRARAADADVTVLGHLPFEDVQRVFGGAWVQAIPSLWHEPFGNVTLEAMARGTAVIGSDTGAMPDLIQSGKTGYLVPAGDTTAWAETLVDLLSNRDLCARMGTAGQRLALANHGRDTHTDRLLQLFDRTIAMHKGRVQVRGKG